MQTHPISPLHIKNFSVQKYDDCWEKMKQFTHSRSADTPDELWLLQHPAVFTLGVAGKKEHLLKTTDIPIVRSDRGGQVTYHGPGQLILYPLLDIKRLNLNTKELVCKLEKIIIQLLSQFSIHGHTSQGAPGVYVNEKKIASIGLRLRKGCSYHGIALNVNMSLKPFSLINPCGYPNLKMCQMSDFIPDINLSTIESQIIDAFIKEFRYTNVIYQKTVNS
jgi:lipoyl(octanoyl) transferase